MDHMFVMLQGKGAAVVCDPWPAKAQAVLWTDHFRAGDKYDAVATTSITASSMGYDPMVEAFKSIDPDVVKTLKPANTIKGYGKATVEAYIGKYLRHGVYDHVYTTKTDAFQDYQCATSKLSTILGTNEQWTAKLAPTLTQVIDPLGTKVGLDPKLRFQ